MIKLYVLMSENRASLRFLRQVTNEAKNQNEILASARDRQEAHVKEKIYSVRELVNFK